MPEQYYIDFEKYTLDQLKFSISNREMIPSRVILKEKMDERFSILKNFEIGNIKELESRLKSKDKISIFSQESGLSVEYLTILKREVSSYHPNPIPLAKLPNVNKKALATLEKQGIKNSKQLFMKTRVSGTADKLSKETGVDLTALEKLISLADLVRLYGVGPVFADLIYNVGVTSVQDFVTYSGEEMVNLYEENTGKKADFSSADIEFSLELAKELLR